MPPPQRTLRIKGSTGEDAWRREEKRRREERERREDDLKREEDEEEARNSISINALYRQHSKPARKVKLVPLDKCEDLTYDKHYKCVAAVGLNGPTIAIIASSKAAIIANVAPIHNYKNPTKEDVGTSDEHAALVMDSRIENFRELRDTMFTDADVTFGVIVAAYKQNNFIVPTVVDMFKQQFERLGLSRRVIVHTYEPHFPSEASGLQRTTVSVCM